MFDMIRSQRQQEKIIYSRESRRCGRIMLTVLMPCTFGLLASLTGVVFLWRKLGSTKAGRFARILWRGQVASHVLTPVVWPLITSFILIISWSRILASDLRWSSKESQTEKRQNKEQQQAENVRVSRMNQFEPAAEMASGTFVRRQQSFNDARLSTQTQKRRRAALTMKHHEGQRGPQKAPLSSVSPGELLGDPVVPVIDPENDSPEARIERLFMSFCRTGTSAFAAKRFPEFLEALDVHVSHQEAMKMLPAFFARNPNRSLNFEVVRKVLIAQEGQSDASYFKLIGSTGLMLEVDDGQSEKSVKRLKRMYEEICQGFEDPREFTAANLANVRVGASRYVMFGAPPSSSCCYSFSPPPR